MDQHNLLITHVLRDHLPFFFHNGPLAVHKVFNRQVLFKRIINPKQTALLQA